MRLLILILFASLISPFCLGQASDYRIIEPGREYLFYDQNSRHEAEGIRIDSITMLSDTVRLYNYEHYELALGFSDICINRNWMYPYVDWEPLEGRYTFYNKFMQPIRWETQLPIDSSWVLMDLTDSTSLIAEVVDTTTISYFDTQTKVKLIRIQLLDTMGSVIPSRLDGITFRLSQDFGLLSWTNWYEFPIKIESASIMSITDPDYGIKRITGKEIFDFEVGDTFHIRTFIRPKYPFPYSSNADIFEEWTVQRKALLPNQAVGYTIEIRSVQIVSTYQDGYPRILKFDSARSFDQTIFADRIYNQDYLDILPYEKVNNDRLKADNLFTGPTSYSIYRLNYTSRYNGRHEIRATSVLWSPQSGTCISEVVDGDENQYAIEGLGNAYYDYTFSVSFGSSKNYRRPVFYRKGNTTWGTRLNFDSLSQQLLILHTDSKPIRPISIYPNPFQHEIVVHHDLNFPCEITLFNAIGEECFRHKLLSETTRLDATFLPPGVYFYQISQKGQLLDQGTIAKH